jgi:hypothetical protein
MTSARTDVYIRVTNQIVAQLKAGTRPWIQPWQASHAAGCVSRPLRLLNRQHGAAVGARQSSPMHFKNAAQGRAAFLRAPIPPHGLPNGTAYQIDASGGCLIAAHGCIIPHSSPRPPELAHGGLPDRTR